MYALQGTYALQGLSTKVQTPLDDFKGKILELAK